jgi:DNA-binding protein HU-beta
MTKADLISAIAIQTGYDRATISTVLEAAMQNIKKGVATGDDVYLRGFGSFVTKTRAQKIARNITKATSIVVPEHKIPYFKPSNEFKDMLLK